MPPELKTETRAKVLLVEDEGIVARDLQRRLERLGYGVIGVVDNGAEALALVEQTRPDVVLMDIVLQGQLDGVETARQLCSRMDVPVIFLTAHSDTVTIRRARETTPYGYLLKPFEERELHTTIEMALYRHRADHKIRDQAASLRELSTRLQTIREEERTRISREIHDVLAQELTLFKLDLTWAARRLAQPLDEATRVGLHDKICEMQRMVGATMTTVQQIATELRPAILDSLGLPAAVEWQASEFQKRTGIQCRPHIENVGFAIPPEQSTALFRILQESLTNVARHAQATQVEVGLTTQAGQLILTVTDNGRGIQEGEATDPRSIGLLGMRERGSLLGGQVEIRGQSNRGTIVQAAIPLPMTDK